MKRLLGKQPPPGSAAFEGRGVERRDLRTAGACLGLLDGGVPANGHFPERLSREQEAVLLRLCASRPLQLKQWAAEGPRFFMAGLAVLVSCVAGAEARKADRRDLLALAEQLSPGVGDPDVFAHWLKHSPVRPSRFLPMLEMHVKHAA